MGEDALLLKHFFNDSERWACANDGRPCTHTYLELGANDGESMSNTLAFHHHLGWRGVLVEASPRYCPDLQRRRCRDVVACGAVCSKNFGGQIDIVENGAVSAAVGMGSTQAFVSKWLRANKRDASNSSITVPCAPLSDILGRRSMLKVAAL